jgi:ABC-type antimicrobial peptide transport system permease subunit
MSDFLSVNPQSEKSEPPSEKSAEKKVVEIIGINSKYDNLKNMVIKMESEVGDRNITANRLEVFINILINALKSETIPASRSTRIVAEIRDARIKNPNIALAEEIKRRLENKDKDKNVIWNEYLENFRTSYIYLTKDSNKQYTFRLLGHDDIHLNAHDLSEFLTGINRHIDKKYNEHHGGRKYKKRKSLKKKRKWSLKYKRSINCKKPKGFSQKQYCKRKNKRTTKKRKSK